MAAKAGTYDAKVKSWHEPGKPPMEESATATRTMALDGRVMVEDFKGSMMGMPFTGHGMRGYDNVSGKHWSTWMDSMSTGLMVSEGTCDDKDACSFKGSWNDPVKKGAGDRAHDVPLDEPDRRGVRDVRSRPRRQGNEDDGDHLHAEVRPRRVWPPLP